MKPVPKGVWDRVKNANNSASTGEEAHDNIEGGAQNNNSAAAANGEP